jgi:hypothetical protein
MFRPLLYGILGFACSVGGAAFAAQPVGVTVDASTTVTGSGPAGSREIRKDSAIFQDDRLKATKSGNAQIILVDKTRIVVGPGAQVDIDNFVFNSDTTFKTVTIRATKGAFRFVSGNSGHSAYKIETPSGTIGVRGTAFDVGIVNGQTHVVMVRGEVQMCARGGKCESLRGLCSYGVMGNGKIDLEGNLRQKGRAEKANFPLMKDEKQLQAQFRLGGGCANTASLPPINKPDKAPAPQAPAAAPQAPSVEPPGDGGAENPPPEPPSTPSGNRSGLADGSNPGRGAGRENSPNQGTGNPGRGGKTG